MNCAKIQAFLP